MENIIFLYECRDLQIILDLENFIELQNFIVGISFRVILVKFFYLMKKENKVKVG